MSDQVVSLIRTFVPWAVGGLLAWLGTVAGITLHEDASTGLSVFLVALLSAVYYALVRALEERWPRFGVLLGAAKQPTYTKTEV